MPVPKDRGGHRPEYKRKREVKVQREKLTDRDPPYPAHLSKVFPIRFVGDIETAGGLVDMLLLVGRHGFALTSPKAAIDGRIYLWLSWECAEYLVRAEILREDRLESTVRR